MKRYNLPTRLLHLKKKEILKLLLTKKVKVRWNPKTKTHYVNKGYKFTKMNDFRFNDRKQCVC